MIIIPNFASNNWRIAILRILPRWGRIWCNRSVFKHQKWSRCTDHHQPSCHWFRWKLRCSLIDRNEFGSAFPEAWMHHYSYWKYQILILKRTHRLQRDGALSDATHKQQRCFQWYSKISILASPPLMIHWMIAIPGAHQQTLPFFWQRILFKTLRNSVNEGACLVNDSQNIGPSRMNI